MAQNINNKPGSQHWYDGLPRWTTRLLFALLAVGLVLVVVDAVLMARFFLDGFGGRQPPAPTVIPTTGPQHTPTATPQSPTATPEPPTATPQSPTATPESPTATPQSPTTTPESPTATPLPPTATPTTPPTATPTVVVWPTATPTPVISEWRGEYYQRDLSGAPVLVRNDRAIDFDWGLGAPAAGLPADGFAVRWTRRLAFEAGLYRFRFLVDDGVRLYVDDVLLIDDWRDGPSRERAADQRLTAGVHTLRIEYYERGGAAVARLGWEKLPDVVDWKGEYWSNRDLSGSPALVRNDARLDFNWGSGSPAAGLPSDRFSARWTRQVELARGTYRFRALVDDGLRLYIDGQLVLDAWSDHDAKELIADYSLAAGKHTLVVEYYDNLGNARLTFGWEPVATPSYPDWKGEYWPNRTLNGEPVLVRNDATLDFNWGKGSPSPGLPADDWSARWTRSVNLSGQTYRFHALVDDGVRVWVDDRLLIDAWSDHSGQEVTGDVALVAGWHTVRVEYYERTVDARLRVWWTALPASFPDWKGEYWPNGDLSGAPALVRNDREIAFEWGMGSVAPGLPADNFSARWTRQLNFQSGMYRLYAWGDDTVRVYVDGRRVIDTWAGTTQDVYVADVALNGTHQLVVEFAEHTGEARMSFWWSRIGNLPAPPTATPTPRPTEIPPAEVTPTPTTPPTATPTVPPTATPTVPPTATPTEVPPDEPTPTPTTPPDEIPEPAGVRLNEVLPRPADIDWDGNGKANERDDWIELVNVSSETIDVGGWTVRTGGKGYRLPRSSADESGTVLEPGEYLVLYRRQSDLALNNQGGVVRLFDGDGKLVDRITFPTPAPDAAYGSGSGDVWVRLLQPSPGAANKSQ